MGINGRGGRNEVKFHVTKTGLSRLGSRFKVGVTKGKEGGANGSGGQVECNRDTKTVIQTDKIDKTDRQIQGGSDKSERRGS